MQKKFVLAGILVILACVAWLIDVGGGIGGWKVLDIAPKIAEKGEYMVVMKTTAGEKLTMSLEEAVVGYVAGEMAATAPQEALRAQAVAARSFACAEQAAAGEICTQSGHCMAYLSVAERQERWGEKFDEYEGLIRKAVSGTAGEMLRQDGEPVKAYFHAACGGRTETVDNLWGGEPKWSAADCYWEGAEGARLSAVYFTKQEMAEKLGVAERDLALLSVADEFGGRICRVSLGRKSWRGADFRSLLGLKSTRFSWIEGAEGVLFTVVGYGHGVGLCQVGAMGMAEQGYDYRRILEQYYPGVDVGVL